MSRICILDDCVYQIIMNFLPNIIIKLQLKLGSFGLVTGQSEPKRWRSYEKLNNLI